MKEFVTNEVKRALKRLKSSFIFILKALFIGCVNVLFWLLPLVLMGYFTLRPMIGFFSVRNESNVSSFQRVPYERPTAKQENAVDVQKTLSSTRSILSEMRAFRRK